MRGAVKRVLSLRANPSRAALPLTPPLHTHARHLNECGRMLSAQMQLILCLSLVLFSPGLWQLIISASAPPG